MKIEIIVEDERTTSRIHANFEESKNPIPALQRAIAQLQAEVDQYHECPFHQKYKRKLEKLLS